MPRPLRGVFFDIDDTLYSTSEFAARARMNACRAMHDRGLNIPTEHIYRELLEVIAEFGSNYAFHFDKLLLRVPRRSYEGVNPAILIASGGAAYHDTKSELKPFPDALELLRRLAATDLVRGIVTSGLEVKQAEKLLRLGVYPHLTPSALFISDQIGISKPNPKLFQRACEECGLEPRECLYVGDDPVDDVDPANAAGLVSVLTPRGPKAKARKGRTEPAYTMETLSALPPVLERDFGVVLPA